MTDIAHVKMIATYVKKQTNKQTNKQTKQNKTNEQNKKDKIVDHNWMGNSFHAENFTNTNKIKQETPKEPKSPYTDVDP